MESIGRRIRNERERQGLTQDELARKMGYKNRSVVSTMEAATELSLKKVKKVATALKVDPGYLMGFTCMPTVYDFSHFTALFGLCKVHNNPY